LLFKKQETIPEKRIGESFCNKKGGCKKTASFEKPDILFANPA
jgi:hypothetical protein